MNQFPYSPEMICAASRAARPVAWEAAMDDDPTIHRSGLEDMKVSREQHEAKLPHYAEREER